MAKRLVASILTAIMVFSLLATPVMATSGYTSPLLENGLYGIGGENSMHPLALNVIVPTNLNFAFDPFMASGISPFRTDGGTTTNQLSQVVETTPFQIINRSGVPVATIFYLDAESETGATFTSGVTNKNDMNATEKQLRFGVTGANTISTSGVTTSGITTLGSTAVNAATRVTFLTAGATSSPFVPFREGTGGDAGKFMADFGFVLGAATDGTDGGTAVDTLAAANAGIAMFMFYADMKTFANWEAGDVSVDGVLWLTPISTEMITSTVPAVGIFHSDLTKGFNMIYGGTGGVTGFPTTRRTIAPAVPPLGFYGTAPAYLTINSLTSATVDLSDLGTATTITIPFVGLTAPGTTVVVNTQTNNPVAESGNYTLSATGITLSSTRTTTIKTNLAAGGSYTIVVTPSGGSATTHTLTFQP